MVEHADIVARLGESKLVLAASSARVLFARVKGYPHWPAQILSDAMAAKKLGKKRRDNDVPVMFFGTNEIALIGKDDCFSWTDGVQKGLLSKGKQKGFIKAIEQVYDFLHLDKKRKAPPHWWCKPPSIQDDAKGQATLEENEEEQQEANSDESGSEEPSDAEGDAEGDQNGAKKHPPPQAKHKAVTKANELTRPASAKGSGKSKEPSTNGNDASLHIKSPTGPGATKPPPHSKPSQPPNHTDPDSRPPPSYSNAHHPSDGGFRMRRTRQAGPEQSSASLADAPLASSGSAREGSVTLVKEEGEGGGEEGLAAYLDEDISKLPAEIRRLAGIKISKRPGSGKAKVHHNTTDDEQGQGLGPSTSMPPPPRPKSGAGAGKKVPGSHLPPRPKTSEANPDPEGDLEGEPLEVEGVALVKKGRWKNKAVKPQEDDLDPSDPSAPELKKPKVEPIDPELSAWGDLVGMTTGRRVLRDRREGLASPASNGAKKSPKGSLASPSGRKKGQNALTAVGSLDGLMVRNGSAKEEGKDQVALARKREREREKKESLPLIEKKKFKRIVVPDEEEEEEEEEAEVSGADDELEAELLGAFATGPSAADFPPRGGRRRSTKSQKVEEEDGMEEEEMGTESEVPPEESEDSGLPLRPRLKKKVGRGGYLRSSRHHDEDFPLSPSTSIARQPFQVRMIAPDPLEPVPACVIAPELAPPPPPPLLTSRRSVLIAASSPTAVAAAAAAAGGSAAAGEGGGGEEGDATTLANGLSVQGSAPLPPARLQSQGSNGPRASRALQQLGIKTSQQLPPALPAQRKIKPTAKFMQGRGLGRRAIYSSEEEEEIVAEPVIKRGGSGSGLGGGRGGAKRNAAKKDFTFVAYDEDELNLEPRETLEEEEGELQDVVEPVEEEEEEEDLLDAEAAEALQLMGLIGMAPRPPSVSLPPVVKEPVILSSGSVLIPAGGNGPLTDGLPGEPTMVAPAPAVPPHEHKLQSFTWPKGDPLLPFHTSTTSAPAPTTDDDFDPFMPPGEWLMIPHPQYEPIKRNAWVNAKRPGRLHREEISICSCIPPELQYDEAGAPITSAGCTGPSATEDGSAPSTSGCRNRQAMIHCDPKTCPCGELCTNKAFHLLGAGPTIQAFLTENRGHGVKAMQAITKGSFVIEYLGEVVDGRELSQRTAEARRAGERHCYAVELAPGLFVDGRKKGNVARLINSSCEPNCEVQRWHDAATGEIRAGIFAKADISPGQELTHDFFFFFSASKGSSSHQLAQEMISFQCLCGAKSCRNAGSLSLASSQGVHLKDRGRRCEVEWEGDGVMYRATVMGYNATTRRHNLLYDDGDREKINLEEVAHRWLDARGMPEGSSHRHSQELLEEELVQSQSQVQRGGSGHVHQGGGKGGNQKAKGLSGGGYLSGGGGYGGGEMDSMASLLQAVQVVQGPGHDLSLGFEPQPNWAQPQALGIKSPGRKGHSRQHHQFNSLQLTHPQPPGLSLGSVNPRVRLDEALGLRIAPCPVPLFRTLPPSSAPGRISCSSPKPFGANPSPAPALTGASVSSSAALYRLQHQPHEVGTLLFDQGSQLSQLIQEASKAKASQQPHIQVNGMMGRVLNSQLLAAMPASAMNTVQLYRAYKFG